MLELRNVTKAYSGIAAVSDVSFRAPAGAVTGYLGPKGSGKSTTLKMIASLIEPSSGEILFDGQPIGRDPMAFTHLLGLHSDRHVSISAYSKGMRQKILLLAALLHNPQLIVLDEPFSGLDVNAAMVLRELIHQFAERGKVVLFSSHELETVERVSSRVVILYQGRVVANDSIDHLRELMSLPTLEEIFSQLAVEQDTAAISRDILQVMEY